MKQYAIKMRELDQRHRQEEGGMNLEATEALKELETIQREKREQLMAIEKERLRERDAKNAQELKEWRQSLTSRKNQLEAHFNKELEKLRSLYATEFIKMNGNGYMVPRSVSTSFFPGVTEEELRARSFTNVL